MYRIEFAEEAVKDLKALPGEDRERILKKLFLIRQDLFRSIERIKGIELWKLRIGDYRAIVRPVRASEVLYVVKIGHRKKIYKKR